MLNVTHAAVTQQLRALEAEPGVVLLRREGHAVVLAVEEERLATAIAEGFGLDPRPMRPAARVFKSWLRTQS